MYIEHDKMDKQNVIIELGWDDFNYRGMWWHLLNALGYGDKLSMSLSCNKIKLKISHSALFTEKDYQLSLASCKEDREIFEEEADEMD